jgi:hypothetical protein
MRKINLFLMFFMLGFWMTGIQNAQAADITQAPCEGAKVTGSSDEGNCGKGPQWNARIAVAPYAQVLAGDSYTFIGISHPSLATAHTSIGVVVEALNMVTVPNTSAGRAAVFTVSAGETHRVFVVNQSHSTINLNNSAFTDTQTHLITTTDALQAGNIKVWSVGTNPSTSSFDTDRPGRYIDALTPGAVSRFDNLSQLSMWGVVYQTSNGAGFALEFVGDMHDSSVTGSGTFVEAATGTEIILKNTSGAGRGIN